MTKIEQPKLSENLNITIENQETEMPGINKTSESHDKSHQDCQKTIAVQNKDDPKSFNLNNISS